MIQPQKQKVYKGEIKTGYNAIEYFIYKVLENEIEFEYMYNKKKHTYRIDSNYLQKEKERESSFQYRFQFGDDDDDDDINNTNIQELKDSSYLKAMIEKYIYNFAQEKLKNGKKKKCNWQKYGGYQNFKDFYYSPNGHYRNRFNIVEISEVRYGGCGNYQDIENYTIVDMQMPQVKQIYNNYYHEDFECDLSKKPRMLHENSEYFDKIQELPKIKNCNCGNMINLCEKSKLALSVVLSQLVTIKKENQKLYEFLKSLRKDKVVEFLQFGSSYVKEVTQNGLFDSAVELDVEKLKTKQTDLEKLDVKYQQVIDHYCTEQDELDDDSFVYQESQESESDQSIYDELIEEKDHERRHIEEVSSDDEISINSFLEEEEEEEEEELSIDVEKTKEIEEKSENGLEVLLQCLNRDKKRSVEDVLKEYGELLENYFDVAGDSLQQKKKVKLE